MTCITIRIRTIPIIMMKSMIMEIIPISMTTSMMIMTNMLIGEITIIIMLPGSGGFTDPG